MPRLIYSLLFYLAQPAVQLRPVLAQKSSR